MSWFEHFRMKFRIILLIFFAVESRCSARVSFRANFIQSFIINEQKPTFIVLFDLCWSENEKIRIANQVSNLGIRVSSMETDFKYQEHLLYLLDLDCSNADQLLNLASSHKLFKQPNRWLILTNSSGLNNIKDTLWNSSFLPDTDVVLAEENGDQYVMVELHRPSLNHTMVSNPRGLYNGTFIDVRPRRELFRRRMDLMGHPLVMANVIQDSNSTRDHLEDELELQNDVISKISWMNAKIAFLMLNATPRYIYTYRYGYRVNGQWSGMINDLLTENAVLGTNCLMTIDRFQVVSFTETLAPFGVRFVFRQPPLSYVSNIYSLPFSSNLWLGVGVCAAVSAAAILVAAKWEASFGTSSTQLSGSLSDAMFWTMSALSQQGCDMEPRRTPGRIMECVVFISLMALYAAYSANIVVLLQAPSNSIRNLAQLASSKITLAAHDLDYNHFVLKQFKDPVHTAVHTRVDPEKGKSHYYDINEGAERIRKGLFAFHSITEQLYRRIEQTFQESEKCDLAEIDYLNGFQPYSPITRGAPYRELISVAFKRMRESGITYALNRRYQVQKPVCAHKATAFSSVGVLDLKPVLVLMLIGFGASLAVLVAEIAVFHLEKNMKKQKY